MGLKAFRATGGLIPAHYCPNCECMRYSPCGCRKKPARRQCPKRVEQIEEIRYRPASPPGTSEETR